MGHGDRATPAMSPDRAAVARLWAEFRRRQPGLTEHAPSALMFGDSVAEADDLAELVIRGAKTAGAALAEQFGTGGDDLPRIGDHGVVCDGKGRPRAVIRTVELRLGPAASVDARFARDDLGRTDGSREEWLDVHRGFFTERCHELGVAYDDDLEVVFERFRVVWPDGGTPEH